MLTERNFQHKFNIHEGIDSEKLYRKLVDTEIAKISNNIEST